MFLPLFVAIFLGLLSPGHANDAANQKNTYITLGTNNQNVPENTPTNGDDKGGETGQIPPPKID